MSAVIVNDASCLIDLRKGTLLHVLLRLPYRFIVPFPIRYSELLDFTPQDWQLLDDAGLETFDLPGERVAEAMALRGAHPKLSANDCFCLVSARCQDEGILLTGDRLLRRVAADQGVRVHGVLWIIDQLDAANACGKDLLTAALVHWRDDATVRLDIEEINARLRRLGRG